MLAGISGIVEKSDENLIFVKSGDFIFQVFCSQQIIENVKIGEKILLKTYLHVRENEISLFGFLTDEDLKIFKNLISVSGIGPKSAIEILAPGGEKVSSAIVSGDINFLTSIRGIGKKTAERMILELKGKVEFLGKVVTTSSNSEILEDAIAGLENLGFSKLEINKKLKKITNMPETAEEIIRQFLTIS